jgi:hypothetical protein
VKCRDKSGDCQKDAYCTSTSAVCPANDFESPSKVCHTKAGDCDKTVNCNGTSAACPNWFESTAHVCQTASCSNGVVHPLSTCDGMSAACPRKQDVACESLACDAAGVACASGSGGSAGASSTGQAGEANAGSAGSSSEGSAGSTSSNGGQGGNPATSGSEVPAAGHAGASQGSVCQTNSDCPAASPHCVGGTCCNLPCTGQCEACDLAGRVGTCSPVPGGMQPVGAKPACDSDGSICGGICDGIHVNKCTYFQGYKPGLGNDKALCVAGTVMLPPACDGSGHVAPQRTQSCGTLGCSITADKCDGPCALDELACASAQYCSVGLCVDKLPSGAPCLSATECISGICADGVMCVGVGGATSVVANAGAAGRTQIAPADGGSPPATSGGSGGVHSNRALAGTSSSVPSDEGGCGCRIANLGTGAERAGVLAGLLALLLRLGWPKRRKHPKSRLDA